MQTYPRDMTLEVKDHPDKCHGCKQGYHYSDGRCSYCGGNNAKPVKRNKRKNIGGKRGRNSGTTGSAKSKR